MWGGALTNAFELIDGLIGEFGRLDSDDDASLDAARQRAEMILRKIFDDERGRRAMSIEFRPLMLSHRVTPEIRSKAFQSGRDRMINLLRTLREELELFGGQPDNRLAVPARAKSRRVFVVHGHDHEMKETVARTLQDLDLQPVILHEKPNLGRVIIEKILDYSDVGFAVVCLSADDVGRTRSQSSDSDRPRPRQNVLLELGFFIGKLGRTHVMPLRRPDDMEIPSDYDGVVYVAFDVAGSWRFDLIRELKACGYEVDANKLV